MTLRKNSFRRILIVDDHALFREGVSSLIARDLPEIEVLEAGSLAEAQKLAKISKEKFDFVLLDLNLGDMPTRLVAADTVAMFPDTPIVVLSGDTDSRLVRSAIEAGAMGFIPKSLSYAEFSAALARSLSGEVYLPQMNISDGLNALRRGRSSPHQRDSASAVARLSPRQLEILRFLVYGLSNRAIAEQLKISEGTVRTHMGRILPSLGVHSRAEAVYLLAKVEQSIGQASPGAID